MVDDILPKPDPTPAPAATTKPTPDPTPAPSHPLGGIFGGPTTPSPATPAPAKTLFTPSRGGTTAADKTAIARRRAFEDDHFGEDCVRIDDQIERGVGSPYAAMSDEQKAYYAALDQLVEAERQCDEANAAMSIAKSNYDTALKAADKAAKAVDEAKVKADKQAADAKARADARAAKQQPASVPHA